MCQQYFFLRHGEVEKKDYLLGRRTDVPLSENGRKQAYAWRKALSGVPFQAIITSPAQRALETAEIIAPSKDMIIQLPHFHEMDWGLWEGRLIAEVKPLLQEQRQRWIAGELEWHPPEGESLSALLRRVQEGMHLVASLYSTGSVLIITHGQLLRVLLSSLMGYPIADQDRFHHRRGQLSWGVRLLDGHFYMRALAVDADTPF
ncbi:MAG: histidine phosphatase family protein [Bacteroidia bacterium]|nr:histidine phosphatase family protein [Bacteroidia bacterium]MDW8014511.1 histidine phosphatase family protein [Bacteroidia bacterium]